ncbi:hypothetical protein [Caballeronia calidae]|uniref:hypothetical protein n=1 Tax=Caballeronia calidae TaxID=1777139 RepID=UPI0007880CA1|nr:hypothetical protein [Caballeronia calidae]
MLNIKGRPFGQLNKPEFGVSDGQEGVQRNLKINPDDDKARIGVNLEGMAYRNWPIASLIRSELAAPTLPRLARHLNNVEDVTVRFARDAWQVTSRPYIAEQLMGGREILLSELTETTWRAILDEAIRCLDATKDYRGRARQAATRIKDGRPEASMTEMDVSPHLTIWVPIDPSLVRWTHCCLQLNDLSPCMRGWPKQSVNRVFGGMTQSSGAAPSTITSRATAHS